MQDWESFFDSFAPKYDGEVFTQNTDAEIEFILKHLRPPGGGTILDVGCGTGRHSVALAAAGFHVTGVDVSAGMLALAQRRAEAASVTVEWVHADATAFKRENAFDAVICLCEGAMCLLTGTDDPFDHDIAILENVYTALRPGGRFLLNVLNGCRQIRAYSDEDVEAGRYDVLNMTERSDVEALVPDGRLVDQLRERGYTPPEIRRMMALVGFELVGVYGGTAGAWNMQPPKLDEMELMIMAERRSG
ncbi:MAG: class I SAM-dependent methyltransferase [Phycisphaerae bacterium]|jgi:SAM-dependent methyltransferase